jgi:3-oxoacyl-[acyl-carrier protein] reductase
VNVGPAGLPEISRLDGRVAIVTGAARGIGRAGAVRLAEAGAQVLLADLDADELATTQDEIDGDTAVHVGDLTSAHVPDALVEAAASRWGRIDIVFNNAGYNWNAPLAEMTDEQFRAMLEIHVITPFRILRAASRYLLAPLPPGAPYRKVVNTSSVSGTMGNPGQANYAAAKAAIIGLTKGLAKEWGDRGVTVNAIAPGFIDTRLTGVRGAAGSIEVAGRAIELGIAPERRRDIAEHVVLGRPGSADEVARAVLFLCSPASDYITGQVLSVNGGLMMGMTS